MVGRGKGGDGRGTSGDGMRGKVRHEEKLEIKSDNGRETGAGQSRDEGNLQGMEEQGGRE